MRFSKLSKIKCFRKDFLLVVWFWLPNFDLNFETNFVIEDFIPNIGLALCVENSRHTMIN